MKKIMILMIALCCAATSFAKRNLKDEKVINEIFSRTDMPEFDNHKVEDKYKNESVVILAKYEELAGVKAAKMSAGNSAPLKYNFLSRYLVKVNDNSAIEKLSTIEYKNRTGSSQTVVGVRVIKANGTVVNVNSEDYLKLGSNLRSKKYSKNVTRIAVPNLQKGDIVDYFIYSEQEKFTYNTGALTFSLQDDYPIQSYRFHGIFLDDARTRYVISDPSIEATVKKDRKNDILDIAMKDVPKIERESFSSNYRSIPFLSVLFGIPYKITEDSSFDYNVEEGLLKKSDEKPVLATAFKNWSSRFVGNYSIKSYKFVKSHFKKYFKAHPEMTEDQKADALYNGSLLMRRPGGYSISPSAYQSLDWLPTLLADFKIGCSLVLGSGRYSEGRENILDYDQYDCAIRLKNSGRFYYPNRTSRPCASDGAYYFEGEKVAVCDFSGITLDYSNGKTIEKVYDVTVPVTAPEQNKTEYKIAAQITNGNEFAMDVNREVSVSGYGRAPLRSELGDYWMWDSVFRNYYGITTDFAKDAKKFKLLEPEQVENIKDNYNGERYYAKASFEKEANEYFMNTVKETKDYKLLSLGMLPNDSVLRYVSTSTVDNLVKSSERSKIIQVGHLLSYTNTKNYSTSRTNDIYFNNTFLDDYHITIQIPSGYSVKNMSELKRTVQNDCGYFSSDAKMENGKLILEVKWAVNNVHFPASDWSKILEVIEAFDTFYESSVVLNR